MVKGGRGAVGEIQYLDIGDDLSEKQKLSFLHDARTISTLLEDNRFSTIEPNSDADWIDQRDSTFENFKEMGNKKTGSGEKIFLDHTNGIKTQRDVWCYNCSAKNLEQNIRQFIQFYNSEVDRYSTDGFGVNVDCFINTDPKQANWTRSLKRDLTRQCKAEYTEGFIRQSAYRPFFKTHLYFSKQLNEEIGQIPRVFPIVKAENRLICVSGIGSQRGISVFMTDEVPDLQFIQNGQYFPLYLYEKPLTDGGLFATATHEQNTLNRRDAITDEGLAHFQASYSNEKIFKEDIFYYVYGLLHSLEYRNRYANNLTRQLPRIPAVKKASDFWAFVASGRRLGDLHCGYETVEPYPVVFSSGDLSLATPTAPVSFYRVEKMKYAGKRPNLDKTTVIYNSNITITGIPLDAYEYVVNSKPALEWVMERQCVKTDKASGIVNDANCYANETAGDPAYPLRLFQRVITVSLETLKIVKALPPLGELS
jgi:predicted helicase